MNKNYLILGLCALLSLASCAKPEPEDPNAGKDDGQLEVPEGMIATKKIVGICHEEAQVVSLQTVGSKAGYVPAEGTEGGSVFSAVWNKEDVIYATAATGAEGENPVLALFTLAGEEGESAGTFESETAIIGKTFSAVYSAAMATFSEDKKHIEVIFPSEQSYVEDGIAPNIIPMYAVGNDPEALEFNYGSGILRLNLKSENPETITKIEVITDVPAAGTMLASLADTKFPSAHLDNGNSSGNVITYNIEGGIEINNETAKQFNIALAASSHCENSKYGSLTIRICTADGRSAEETYTDFEVKAGTVYDFPELSVVAIAVRPAVEFQSATSSTLSFKWTINNSCWYDRPYTVGLYSNEACSDDNLIVSWDIEADAPQYTTGGEYKHPTAFNFSGLTPEASYWCKVTDGSTGLESKAVSGTTEAFTAVTVGSEAVEAGGTVLAEDFSELVWNGDLVHNGLSYIASDPADHTTFEKAEGADHDGYELAACTSAGSIAGYSAQAAATRFASWGWLNSETYACSGFWRLGTAEASGKIVTPELTNLKETASLKVSFKLAPFYDHDQPAKPEANIQACISILEGAVYDAVTRELTLADGASETVAESFDIDQTKNTWTKYEYTVPNVPTGARIAIGSAAGADNRMFIDEIEITVKKYEKLAVPVARLQGATSSTLSFQWSENGFTKPKDDAAQGYEAALYRDADCKDLFVSWKIEKNSSLYKLTQESKSDTTTTATTYHFQPAFNFSGLDANTTYYFRVRNTGTDMKSEPVAGTTEEFAPVTVGNDKVEAGGTVLAEDFSELVWGGDFVYPGLSSKAEDKSVFVAATGENPTDKYDLVNSNTEDQLFNTEGIGNATAQSRLADWGYQTNNMTTIRLYGRLGHLKLGTAGDWARVVTPVLSNLKDTATVKVSFKASPFYEYDQKGLSDPLDACITVLDGQTSRSDNGRITAEKENRARKFDLVDEKNVWTEYEYELHNITPESRISIGAISEKKKHRMFIDDVKITVVAYEVYPVPVVRLQGATSSSLSFQWSMNNFEDIEKDYLNSYRVGLYKDAACTDLVFAWDIADNDKFKVGGNSLQPAFNFSGLAANTSYWCKVTDLESGVGSEAVTGKTDSFPVGVEDETVLLAEDFSELVNGGGLVYPGASVQKSKELAPATGDNPSGFSLIDAGTDNNLFNTSNLGNAVNKSDRLKDWGSIGSDASNSLSVYARLDAVKVGTGSRGGMIVTPELKGLGDRTATVKVSFKASPYYNNDLQSAMDGLKASAIVYKNTSMSGHKVTGTKGETATVTLKDKKNVWNTYECTLDNVTATDRIAIGMDGTKTDGKNNYRMFIDEIVITVVSYNEQ